MVLNCMFYVVSVEADLVECIYQKENRGGGWGGEHTLLCKQLWC